jgi:hypothetical protein
VELQERLHVERLIMFLYKETLTFYALSKYSAANIVTEWRVSACIVQTLTSICKIKPDLSGLLILFGDFNFFSCSAVFLLLRRIYKNLRLKFFYHYPPHLSCSQGARSASALSEWRSRWKPLRSASEAADPVASGHDVNL